MNQQNAHLYVEILGWLIEDGVVQFHEYNENWIDKSDLVLTYPPDRYRRKPQPLKLVVGEKYQSGEDVWTVIYEVTRGQDDDTGFIIMRKGQLGWVGADGKGGNHTIYKNLTLTAIPKDKPALVEGWATYYPEDSSENKFGGIHTDEKDAGRCKRAGAGIVIHMREVEK